MEKITKISIFIGILLLFNLFMQNLERNCESDVDNIVNYKENAFFEFNKGYTTYTMLALFSGFNDSSNFIVKEDMLHITSAEGLEYFMRNQENLSREAFKKVRSFSEEIIEGREKCRNYNLIGNFILMMVLIIYLLIFLLEKIGQGVNNSQIWFVFPY